MLLALFLFFSPTHATERLDRNVVVTLEPTEESPGTLEFVGCSKACHESEETHEDIPDTDRLMPADRYTVETNGEWPVETRFSMRDDLYYFALFGPSDKPPKDRRFSLRKHAGEDTPIRFEIGPTRISEQKNARAMPAPPVLAVPQTASSQSNTRAPSGDVLRPLSAPPPAGANPLKIPLGFLLACAVGGLLGWALVRRSP